MRKRMSEEQKKEAQTPEDEVKKEAGSAEATETPEEDNAPEAEKTEEKSEEKAEEKADDGNEKYVRLMAEFQNYKKRVAKEKNDIREYALAASAEDDPAGYAKGMELIFTQMVTELQKSGLAEVEAEGQDFDPTKHNAVMTEENEELESGKVSKVLQKGYALNDKVIRPSMVAVTK